MRKEGVIAFILLFCLPMVMGLSVSLNSPNHGNITNMTSVIFSCSTVEEQYTISSISLYMNTTSSSWIKIETQSNASSSAYFTINSLSGDYIWNCLVLNSNGDNVSASSNYSLTVSTLAFSGTIADQTVTEDTNTSTLFVLDTYFTGASSYTFSGNTTFYFNIDSSNRVTITPLANETGAEIVTIIGVSGASTVTSNSFLVNITNVNDAPLRKTNINNITLEKNTNSTLNMDTYFTDPDKGTNLTYILSSSHITLFQNESTVTLTPETNWEGTVNATITATDGSASVDSNTFTIVVGASYTQENTSPTISSYSPDSDLTLEVGLTQDFTITYSDSDGDTLITSWSVNTINQESSADTFSFTPTEEGIFVIIVTVSDGTEEATHSWTITVGNQVLEVDSILSEQSSSSTVCGNNIIENGETCSSCALDVICSSGNICNNGSCEQKQSIGKAILILVISSVIILILGIGIYYFTTLKKDRKKPNTTTFQYSPVGASPPIDYTDFYKGKQ